MYKTYSMELAGRTLTMDVGRVGKQAGGCVLIHYADTTLLCTATTSAAPRDGIDFFPLSVEYTSSTGPCVLCSPRITAMTPLLSAWS